MIDYHVHSNISYDGKSSPQEYIDIAHLKGIKEFTFTENFDYLNGVSNINLYNYSASSASGSNASPSAVKVMNLTFL